MTKHGFLLAIALILFFNSNAQEFDIGNSPELDIPKGYLAEFIDQDDSFLFVLIGKKKVEAGNSYKGMRNSSGVDSVVNIEYNNGTEILIYSKKDLKLVIRRKIKDYNKIRHRYHVSYKDSVLKLFSTIDSGLLCNTGCICYLMLNSYNLRENESELNQKYLIDYGDNSVIKMTENDGIYFIHLLKAPFYSVLNSNFKTVDSARNPDLYTRIKRDDNNIKALRNRYQGMISYISNTMKSTKRYSANLSIPDSYYQYDTFSIKPEIIFINNYNSGSSSIDYYYRWAGDNKNQSGKVELEEGKELANYHMNVFEDGTKVIFGIYKYQTNRKEKVRYGFFSLVIDSSNIRKGDVCYLDLPYDTDLKQAELMESAIQSSLRYNYFSVRENFYSTSIRASSGTVRFLINKNNSKMRMFYLEGDPEKNTSLSFELKDSTAQITLSIYSGYEVKLAAGDLSATAYSVDFYRGLGTIQSKKDVFGQNAIIYPEIRYSEFTDNGVYFITFNSLTGKMKISKITPVF